MVEATPPSRSLAVKNRRDSYQEEMMPRVTVKPPTPHERGWAVGKWKGKSFMILAFEDQVMLMWTWGLEKLADRNCLEEDNPLQCWHMFSDGFDF